MSEVVRKYLPAWLGDKLNQVGTLHLWNNGSSQSKLGMVCSQTLTALQSTHETWLVLNAVSCRSWPRLSPGQWAVHETAPNTKVAAACFYRIRRLLQIRRRVGEEVTTRLVLALVISRLDYCNSLLAGLPFCTTEPLQHVQNAAARLLFELSPSENITSSLLHLHWLPIRWCVQLKLSCFLHAVVNGAVDRIWGASCIHATS